MLRPAGNQKKLNGRRDSTSVELALPRPRVWGEPRTLADSPSVAALYHAGDGPITTAAVMGIDAPTATVKHPIQAAPVVPLDNPALVSVPLGFLAAVVASLATREHPDAERLYDELNVRANTGLGAV